jgi:hypothetical protein
MNKNHPIGKVTKLEILIGKNEYYHAKERRNAFQEPSEDFFATDE